SSDVMPYFALLLAVGLFVSVLMIKTLNALLLGERYAENLGVNVKMARLMILATVGLLTSVVTAFCGPVAFIGLAVPHISRLMLGSSNHDVLLPQTMALGAVVALLCNVLCVLPGDGTVIPVNAMTPVLGAPVIIYVIVNQRKIQYLN
ncbi:MAG: iron chelate uptake ABC transporter family permease subunit, partial [Paludibacteraceae bacterium]|nr:iron chelate uptake ABC transporter family permease subunit [Paludibacteraceae bacterium]